MSNVREFRPLLMPRKGEIYAWAITLGVGVVLFLLTSTWSGLPAFLWMFESIMLFSAFAISFGNWVDRQTILRLRSEGVEFDNRLRSVRLGWAEVQGVAVVETRAGKRVQVQGENSHFTFKTHSIMSMFGQSVASGFENGDEILNTILDSCGLKYVEEIQGVQYYARA